MVAAPWIDIPVDALTLDYEFKNGDYAFLKEHIGHVKHINHQQEIALVTMDDGNEIEVSIALLGTGYSPEPKELARGDYVYLKEYICQIKHINQEQRTALVDIVKEVPITLLGASWWDKNKPTARNLCFCGDEKAKLGDYEGAWKDFAQATSFNPGFAEAVIGQGVATTELWGDCDSTAIDDYCTAIRLDPDYSLGYFKRCLSNYQLSHVQEEDFEIAACYNQCFPHYMRFRPQDAKPNFEAALECAKQEGNQRLQAYIEKWLREIY